MLMARYFEIKRVTLRRDTSFLSIFCLFCMLHRKDSEERKGRDNMTLSYLYNLGSNMLMSSELCKYCFVLIVFRSLTVLERERDREREIQSQSQAAHSIPKSKNDSFDEWYHMCNCRQHH